LRAYPAYFLGEERREAGDCSGAEGDSGARKELRSRPSQAVKAAAAIVKREMVLKWIRFKPKPSGRRRLEA